MKILLAALVGALVSFAWGYVSWMQLGWHEAGMFSFKDEKQVAAVIRANVSRGRGIYQLPGVEEPPSFATPEQKREAAAAKIKAHEEGPYVWAVVRPGSAKNDMVKSLLLSFGRSFLACLIAAGMLACTVLTYPGRIAFAAGAGVFATLIGDGQMWVWFELPNRELLVNLADHFVEWLLVGAVLGLFVGRAPTANEVG